MSDNCQKKVLMSGNQAMAEAAVRAGCRFYAGYPITPQNELTAYMAKRMPEVGGTFLCVFTLFASRERQQGRQRGYDGTFRHVHPFFPQHFLYFFPLPHGQASFRPTEASYKIPLS